MQSRKEAIHFVPGCRNVIERPLRRTLQVMHQWSAEIRKYKTCLAASLARVLDAGESYGS